MVNPVHTVMLSSFDPTSWQGFILNRWTYVCIHTKWYRIQTRLHILCKILKQRFHRLHLMLKQRGIMILFNADVYRRYEDNDKNPKCQQQLSCAVPIFAIEIAIASVSMHSLHYIRAICYIFSTIFQPNQCWNVSANISHFSVIRQIFDCFRSCCYFDIQAYYPVDNWPQRYLALHYLCLLFKASQAMLSKWCP